MTRAFVYKWTELSSGKWYVGSRTAKNCHPDDGYICSSKIVKPMIKANPDNWVRQVLCIGHPRDMYELEGRLLVSLDAANDPRSYNQTNGGKNFGNKGKQCSAETKRKLSVANKGKQLSAETKRKLSEASKGKQHSAETKQRMCEASRNRPKLICPHCGKEITVQAFARYHGDKCKHKPTTT